MKNHLAVVVLLGNPATEENTAGVKLVGRTGEGEMEDSCFPSDV
jgi:hypothetical protein